MVLNRISGICGHRQVSLTERTRSLVSISLRRCLSLTYIALSGRDIFTDFHSNFKNNFS